MPNPEKEQDRVFDAMDHFKRFGLVIFKENEMTYRNIKNLKTKGTVLEAGCGNGAGTCILRPDIATDKLYRNVVFAKAMHPDIDFQVWDISESPYKKHDVVVCVEAIEHIADIESALKNLILSANKEVWFSTPNRKDENPDNPFHVREYDCKEIIKLVSKVSDRKYDIDIYNTKGELLSIHTDDSPLIYGIKFIDEKSSS